MKVLMFGWEFPPHISGGLGTACYGLTRALTEQDVEVLFVAPKADSGQPFPRASLLSANDIPLTQETPESTNDKNRDLFRKMTKALRSIQVKSTLQPYVSIDPLEHGIELEAWNYQIPDQKKTEVPLRNRPGFSFSGGYGSGLLEEIQAYAVVAEQIASQNSFDVIHAHDWMTYPAGIAAKQSSGKPLVVHVHATEFDRSGLHENPEILNLEKTGMMAADSVIAVSELTRKIIIDQYHVPPGKVKVVHNGVQPKTHHSMDGLPSNRKRVITFLGRVTHQKGPGYFIDASALVHKKFPEVHFVMAGSGDMLPAMIRKVASLKLSSHFHFTGFLNSEKVNQVWAISEMYVMPSVSEPFGITPLEAMAAGVPVIISKQSGVSEVVNHAIKVDFWNVEALANAMMSLLHYRSLSNTVKKNSAREVKKINWSTAARKIKAIYHETLAQN